MTAPDSSAPTARPDVLIGLGIAGVFAFALGFSLLWRPAATGAVLPTAGIVEPTAQALPAPAAEEEPVSAPAAAPAASEPLPTAEAYLVPVNEAQAAPGSSAPAVDIFANPNDLTPIPSDPMVCENRGRGACRGGRP